MMYDRDDDVSGFKHLCIYVDAGLVGRELQIAKILSVVDGQIYSYEHYAHTRWPMFFGIEPDKLISSKPLKIYSEIRSCDWEKIVKKHLLPEAPSTPAIIPRIRNSEVARTRSLDRCDLGLFFCRNGDVFVRSEEEQRFFRQIGPRCIWIFFNEEETPQMEAGIFIPQLLIASGNALE
jgi:hypothetical protein